MATNYVKIKLERLQHKLMGYARQNIQKFCKARAFDVKTSHQTNLS